MRKLAAIVIVSVGLGIATGSPASAAFPGRDGLLAVQPLHGGGLLLVDPRSGAAQRLCPDTGSCPLLYEPRWSADGQVIGTAEAGLGVALLYPDGTCMNCAAGPGIATAFTRHPGVVDVVTGGGLFERGIDGVRDGRIAPGPLTDAAWSSTGRLATVADGQLWTGRPGSMHRIAVASSPSWSPSGSALAVDEHGWITVIDVRDSSQRRLVRGSAPAWSPDGRSIAFISRAGRLSLIQVHGTKTRTLDNVRGTTVDWQPIAPSSGCVAPAGSTTVASSPAAVVTKRSFPSTGYDAPEPPSSYLGCLASTGREYELEDLSFQSEDQASTISSGALAGPYAALVQAGEDYHYGGSSDVVQVFDLGDGQMSTQLGGEQVGCEDYDYGCYCHMDQLVIAPDGATAVHVQMFGDQGDDEQLLASDSTGQHVLDSISDPSTIPLLTDLQLSGSTLTWDHDGSPESAQLP